MIEHYGHRLALATICLLYLLTAGWLSRSFPPFNGDEVSNVIHAHNIVSGLGNRDDTFDDVFAPSVYYLRDSAPEISKLLNSLWVGAWLKALGLSPWKARLSSVGAGLFVLLLAYAIGCRLAGPRVGCISALLFATHPCFLTASCLVRPEIVLLMGGMGVLWVIIEVPYFLWKPFVVGALCGLLMSVHQNSAAAYVGSTGFFLAWDKRTSRGRILFLGVLGFAAGLIAILSFVDLRKFILAQRLFYAHFYTLPLMDFPWRPLSWFQDLLGSLWRGQTYYVQPNARWEWTACMHVAWTGTAISLFGIGIALRNKNTTAPRQALKSLLAGLLFTPSRSL